MGEDIVWILERAGPQLAAMIIIGMLAYKILDDRVKMSPFARLLVFFLTTMSVFVLYFVPPKGTDAGASNKSTQDFEVEDSTKAVEPHQPTGNVSPHGFHPQSPLQSTK